MGALITNTFVNSPSQLGAGAVPVVLIQTITINNQAAATFSAIPYYKKYVVVGSFTTSTGGEFVGLTFNADSGSNYTTERLNASTTTVSAASGNTTYITLQANSNQTIPDDYFLTISNTAAGVQKNAVGLVAIGGGQILNVVSATWSNTAAVISRMDFAAVGSNLNTGVISLYGLVE